MCDTYNGNTQTNIPITPDLLQKMYDDGELIITAYPDPIPDCLRELPISKNEYDVDLLEINPDAYPLMI